MNDKDRPDPEGESRRILRAHSAALRFDDEEEQGIQEIFRLLVEDDARSQQICDDVATATANGRNCLVLTQRTAHVERLVALMTHGGMIPIVMQCGMGKTARSSAMADVKSRASLGGLVLVATGGYLGEGFDVPELDTLFLTFPLAFKGRVVQYVGRVLRPKDAELNIEVHDYVDRDVPVLARMHDKRLAAYRSLGFEQVETLS